MAKLLEKDLEIEMAALKVFSREFSRVSSVAETTVASMVFFLAA
jgi:hypothetical protein